MNGRRSTRSVASDPDLPYRAPYRIDVTRTILPGQWPVLDDPRAALELGYQHTRSLDIEVLLVLGMSGAENLLYVQELNRGTATNVRFRPAEVFRTAVIENATRIVVIHNHPSGDPFPSVDDRASLERLRLSGQALGIEVYDYQIVAAHPAAGWSAKVGDLGYFVRSAEGDWEPRAVEERPKPGDVAAETAAAAGAPGRRTSSPIH